MSKLSNLLELLIMLQYKEFATASELADILEVDKKTIYRYINTLQMCNIPVESKKGRYGGFYIDENFYIKYPKLTRKELEALLIASKILTKENGFFYADELQSSIVKIKKTSLNSEKELQEFEDSISFKINDIGNLEEFNDIISKINYAMSKGRVLKIKYFSMYKNSETERLVNPYTILYRRGVWYLIAYCNIREEERIFRISRIKSIEITDDIFIKPRDFNLKKYLKNSWGIFRGEETLVKVKFDKEIANFIKESKWHPSQEIQFLDDGSIIFEVYVNGLGEIKKWILSFGVNAEVIEPKSLRNEIKNEMIKIVEKYTKNIE